MMKRNVRYPLEWILLFPMLIWAIIVFLESLTFEEIYAYGMPILVSAPLIVLTTVLIVANYHEGVRSVVQRYQLEESVNLQENEKEPTNMELLKLLVAIASFFLAVPVVGLFWSVPVYMFTYLYIFNITDAAKSAIIALVTLIIVSVIFGTFLEVYALEHPFELSNIL